MITEKLKLPDSPLAFFVINSFISKKIDEYVQYKRSKTIKERKNSDFLSTNVGHHEHPKSISFLTELVQKIHLHEFSHFLFYFFKMKTRLLIYFLKYIQKVLIIYYVFEIIQYMALKMEAHSIINFANMRTSFSEIRLLCLVSEIWKNLKVPRLILFDFFPWDGCFHSSDQYSLIFSGSSELSLNERGAWHYILHNLLVHIIIIFDNIIFTFGPALRFLSFIETTLLIHTATPNSRTECTAPPHIAYRFAKFYWRNLVKWKLVDHIGSSAASPIYFNLYDCTLIKYIKYIYN